MNSKNLNKYILILFFIIIYSVFVFKVNFNIDNYSDIIVGTTFFFALFVGFFITRQNDRYSAINDLLTSTDGYFSYLYRVTGLVPRIQNEVREIIRAHYMKIKETNNPAHHVMNPSDSITKITQKLSSVTQEELDSSPACKLAWGFSYEVISGLQLFRKKTLNLYNQRLVSFQWAIIYILGTLLVISFNFVPTTILLVDILKVLFGTSVFISIILLKELDNLTLFGDSFGKYSVEDVFRIIDEMDAVELKNSKNNLN